MVKIVEVDDEEPNADRDDEECYEIDPAEFAKKVNLKEPDDVVLVAAKGKIKLEGVVDLDEDLAKPLLGGYGCCAGAAAGCSRMHAIKQEEFAFGDGTVDNPCQIEEDEPVLLQMEIVEDRFALGNGKSPPPEFGAADHGSNDIGGKPIRGCKDERRRRTAVTPPCYYKIVVKGEPDDDLDSVGHGETENSGPGAEDDDGTEGQIFHGDKDAPTNNVVSDELGAKPSEPVGNVPDVPAAKKCEPVAVAVDPDSVSGAEEEDEDGFVIV